MARTSNCRKGFGLKCCANATLKANREKQNADAAAIYAKRIEEIGKLEILGEYKAARKPLLHRCKLHGGIYEALPTNTLKGYGLPCCKGHAIESSKLLKDDGKLANSTCHVYLARINGAYLKPGIAKDPQHRIYTGEGYYDSYAYVSPPMTTGEAWAIEQRLLKESMDAKPETLPQEYGGWGGYSELRLKDVLPESWYISRFWELMTEVDEEGWECVANS